MLPSFDQVLSDQAEDHQGRGVDRHSHVSGMSGGTASRKSSYPA